MMPRRRMLSSNTPRAAASSAVGPRPTARPRASHSIRPISATSGSPTTAPTASTNTPAPPGATRAARRPRRALRWQRATAIRRASSFPGGPGRKRLTRWSGSNSSAPRAMKSVGASRPMDWETFTCPAGPPVRLSLPTRRAKPLHSWRATTRMETLSGSNSRPRLWGKTAKVARWQLTASATCSRS